MGEAVSHPRSVFQPLPGRKCGDCHACCVEPAIDDPELSKPEEVACPHLVAGGCGIYARRPVTCATWFCGWRLINMSDALRPDRSRVLMIPELSTEPGYEKGGLRLAPIGDDLEVLLQDEVVDLAGRFVANGVPMFLSYGSGDRSKRVLINALGKASVQAGDRAGFVRVLRGVLARLSA
jgi:hypothetical protein